MVLFAALTARLFAADAAAPTPGLDAGFADPPLEARPLVWWHWINGNITKAGIEADLADMKRVGIGGAQMFDVSIYLPPGPVRYGTDAWHEHVQFAIRTAAKYGLEFHAMNTPGWSASGGPWVKPERSMKQLVWTETPLAGGTGARVALPQPLARLNFYRDAAVIAVPTDPEESNLLASQKFARLTLPEKQSPAALLDRDTTTTVALGAGKSEGPELLVEFTEPVELTQLKLDFAALTGKSTFRGSLEGSSDGKTFTKFYEFNLADHEGPPPQLIFSFKPARARFVKLTVAAVQSGKRVPFSLANLELGAPPRLPDWTAKIKSNEGGSQVRPSWADSAATATVGAIARNQIIDVTAECHDGVFQGTLPAGRWTLLRFGFTSTGSTNHPAVPEGHGLEIDKMDPDAVSFYFDQAMGRIVREAGPLAGTTFKGLLFDSFEGGMQNWTDTFPAQFVALKGYDLVPYLPALTGRIVETPIFTECVLSDFRSAVEALIAKDYFGTMQRRAREHGMILSAEAQGGPLNPVSAGEYVDVPMNEFWLPATAPRAPRIKIAASVANVLGRKIVGAESFTAKPEDARWMAVPSNIKDPGDYAWSVGINRFILHHYVHQPGNDGPGFGLGRYGTHFGRLNSWWPLAKGWVDYVSRSQFLLQQGHTVADVCFLQNEDHGYGFPSKMVDLPAGYDFDIVYPRHLADLTWQGGALRLPSGSAYRLLSLPENWAADLPTLRQLRDLAKAGAPIAGPAPVAPFGVKDYDGRAEYDALVSELWGKGSEGLIKIKTPNAAAGLAGFNVPADLKFPAAPKDGEFRFLHRRADGAEIYFVFNHSDQPVNADFSFRVTDRRPEIWDAVNGVHAAAPVFRPSAEGLTVPLELEPHGSRFVIFRAPLPARWVQSAEPASLDDVAGHLLARSDQSVTLHYSDGKTTSPATAALPAPLTLSGAWNVTFLDGRGAPPSAVFDSLVSWTEHRDPGVKYYSGTANYQKRFTAPPHATGAGESAWLDLGQVADLAEVTLNGKSLGILWQPPFRVDVSQALVTGENLLEVKIANRWINRVIGDEQFPAELTYGETGNKFTDGALQKLPAWLYDPSQRSLRKRYSFTTWKHYSADSPLVPAGLLGPVRLEWLRVIDPATP